MSFVVEAVVSTVIGVLIEKLASSDLLQLVSERKIRADLEKWKKTLVAIQDVLDDAEEKQMTKPSVKIWLQDLQNLAYDVEDILDEFAADALQRQSVKKPSGEADHGKLIEFIQFSCLKPIGSCFTSMNQYSLKISSTMASQIKEITTRFEGILEKKNSLGLIEYTGPKSNRARYERLPTSHLKEPHIYGREEDEEAILELLLKDDGAAASFSVMSIEGMGGLGKTTLAQLAFNHDKVKTHFDIRVWLCVSEDFDVVRITKSILESIDRGTTNIVDDLSNLHGQLKDKLSGKKFLIVLDDVWNEDYEKWTSLCLPFGAGSQSQGSKILVTTRNHSVSLKVGALVTYKLQELEDDACLSILIQHSMLQRESMHLQNFQQIGQRMAERCKGVPLAAKTLGGLLRGKAYPKDWEKLLDSNMWTLLEDQSGLVPALKVSYYYLPPILKRCFAYCSVFPKDHEFAKNELILLWMAEGFLQTGKKEPEDLGEEYFDDLHSMSFFQQLSNSGLFVMHDLINDLAGWAANDFYFRMENMLESKTLSKMKNLRTFVITSRLHHTGYDFYDAYSRLHGICYDFHDALLRQQRLRVLSLKGCSMFELPSSISDLKLLHHLDLSYSEIEFLPDSINTIHNLEVLILDPCWRLRRLCSDVGNLMKLRHVYIYAEQLETMPLGIGQLTTLRTLTQFVLGENTASGLGDLKDLKDLRGKLHIWRLENVNDPEDAEKADLNGKTGLKDLQLQWSDNTLHRVDRNIATQVLENLRPCQELESLDIIHYPGPRFPNWLGDNSLSNLKCLTIFGCRNCNSFPSIWQLTSLEILRMESLFAIKSLGPEVFGHGSAQAFTRLRQLHILYCDILEVNLPDHLPSLEILSIKDCSEMTVYLPNLPKHCTVEIVSCFKIAPRSFQSCSSLSSMIHNFSGISSYILLAERSSEVEKLDVAVYEQEKREQSLTVNLKSKSLRSMFYADMISHTFYFLDEEIEEEQKQQQQLPRVQYLILKDCSYPEKLGEAIRRLTFLRGLFIGGSPNLISFPEADLPPILRFVIIHGCTALQSLPKAWIHSSNNTSLDNLCILNCESLEYIARVQLKLKRLNIWHCSKLLTVLDDDQEGSGTCSKSNACLESLKIEECQSLTSLCSNNNDLPDTIQEIDLRYCTKLVSLTSRGNLPKDLRDLNIHSCPKLASIAESFHGNTKLVGLSISNCHGLDTLPSGMGNLNSLQSLSISNCLGMESIPDGGFPTSLESLTVSGKMCKSLLEWGLHRLVSLRELYISVVWGVMSFPQEDTGMVLPPSLTTLSIKRFVNLKRLSSIAEYVTCLEKLYLISCPELEFFPDNGLPDSLSELKIINCPLLQERCKSHEERLMIAHIPKVQL